MLRDQLGIASAGQTYEAHRVLLDSPRWQRTFSAGAPRQRLLWASTGTKDPNASDILHVRARRTLNREHDARGHTADSRRSWGDRPDLPVHARSCDDVLAKFATAGVDPNVLATQLQEEGAQSFVKSWEDLLACIAERSAELKKAG